MALAASSTDVVGYIVGYLDAIATIRLLECGHVILSAKIKQSCKKLELETWPFMKFPFSLFNFPQLNSLSLLHHRHVSGYPLRLNGTLPLPHTPVKSLLKLSLSCIQSFSVLRLQGGIPILDIIFPNLKSLHLTHSAIAPTLDHMEAIPQGLEELSLASLHTAHRALDNHFLILLKLPPTLKSLSIFTKSIPVHEKTKDYSTVVWPAQLTSLSLRLIEPSILSHLPPHLETLSLTLFTDDKNQVSPSPIPTSIFPASLTDLAVYNLSRYSISFAPTSFPPSLKRCALSFDYSFPDAPGWLHLPKSLTRCSLKPEFARVGTFIDRLPNLTDLFGFFLFGPSAQHVVPELPHKLEELVVRNASLATILHLPPTITEICLGISPLSSTSQPPSNEISPILPNLAGGDMSRLPPYLTSLDLENASPGQKFSSADFFLLPSTLTKLAFKLHDIQDIETISAIPRYLRSLKIDNSVQHAFLEIRDFSFLDDLPVGLETFTLSTEHDRIPWDRWAPKLLRFKELKTLSLLLATRIVSTRPISLEFVSFIPNTVTDLTFAVHCSTITPKIMEGLPKQLSSLTLQSLGSYSHGSSATDECFANLPKPLVYLRLPSEIIGLTKNILMLLPSTLVTISLPEYISRNKRTFYEREADWGNYVPL